MEIDLLWRTTAENESQKLLVGEMALETLGTICNLGPQGRGGD